MARTSTPFAAALTMAAALPLVAACAAPVSGTASTSDRFPTFGWAPPRMRAPSSDRPAWLPSSPVDPPRVPAPEHGFRA
jgi:hypothetical protein